MPAKPADEGLQSLAEIDKLIHEPARLMILATLHAVESADFPVRRTPDRADARQSLIPYGQT